MINEMAQMKQPEKEVRKPRVYAFVDSQNLNLGTQKMGWKVDWAKFHTYLREKYGVSKVYLFIGYVPEYEPMYEQLHEQGYFIVLKPTVGMTAKPGEAKPSKKEEAPKEKPAVKGNIDAELVLYAMKEMPNYDKAIVVSGDGDFYCLVEYLAGKNRLLNIMTPNWQYSSLLKEFDDYVVRLDEHRKELAYRDFKKRK
jgi:uncharacterized LabA/DUF88 family protein